MVTAWIGLGSNIGDRIAWHRRAVTALNAQAAIRVIAESRYYESPALLPENAPVEWNSSFINQVVLVETSLSPAALLLLCQQTEVALGRRKTGRWGPREIDIDIIAYGDQHIDLPHLRIPHPEMTKRDFVLLPLRDVSPDWVYPAGGPQSGMGIDRLCEALPAMTALAVESE